MSFLYVGNQKIFKEIICKNKLLSPTRRHQQITRLKPSLNITLHCSNIFQKQNPNKFQIHTRTKLSTKDTIDKKLLCYLRWYFEVKHYVENIISKSYRSLGFILRQPKNFWKIVIFKVLNFTLVRSQLTTIWHPHNIGLIKEIHIFFKSYGNHTDYNVVRTIDLRRMFQIQSLSNSRSISLWILHISCEMVKSATATCYHSWAFPGRFTREVRNFASPLQYSCNNPFYVMLRFMNEVQFLADLDLIKFKKFKSSSICF